MRVARDGYVAGDARVHQDGLDAGDACELADLPAFLPAVLADADGVPVVVPDGVSAVVSDEDGALSPVSVQDD